MRDRASDKDENMDRSVPQADRSNDIDVDNDDLPTQRLKLDLAISRAELEERQKIFKSRMAGFKVIFYPLLFLMFILALWSVYVLLMLPSASEAQIEIAKFIVSTLASAAVAALIGFLATHPAK